MTTHTVTFKTLINCPDPALTAFNIEVREKGTGTVLAAVDESTAATTLDIGVTYTAGPVGGLPTIVIDDAVIDKDIRVEFVDFTTSCGTQAVGDLFDAVQTTAAPELGPQDTGCLSEGGVSQINGRNAMAGTAAQHYSNTTMMALSKTGRIFGNGQTLNTSYGALGAQSSSLTSGRDPNLWGGRSFTDTDVNVFFANIEAYLPGMRFKQIEAAQLNARFLALSTDGRLFGWGGAVNEADREWLGPGGAGPSDFSTGLVPVEILSPSGRPWDEFYSKNVSTTTHYVYGLSDGVWYGWGSTSNKDLAGLGIENSGNVVNSVPLQNVFTPTPLAYPVQPQVGLKHGPFALGFLQVARQWYIGTDGQIRWYGTGVTNTDEYGSLNAAVTYDPQIYTLQGEPNNAAIQLNVNATCASALGEDGRVYHLANDNSAAPFAGATGAIPVNSLNTTFVPMSDGVKPSGVKITEIVTDAGGYVVGLGDDGVPYVAGRNSTGWETFVNEPDLVGVTSITSDGHDIVLFNTPNGAFVRGMNIVEPSQQLTHQSATKIHRLATSPTWNASGDTDSATQIC